MLDSAYQMRKGVQSAGVGLVPNPNVLVGVVASAREARSAPCDECGDNVELDSVHRIRIKTAPPLNRTLPRSISPTAIPRSTTRPPTIATRTISAKPRSTLPTTKSASKRPPTRAPNANAPAPITKSTAEAGWSGNGEGMVLRPQTSPAAGRLVRRNIRSAHPSANFLNRRQGSGGQRVVEMLEENEIAVTGLYSLIDRGFIPNHADCTIHLSDVSPQKVPAARTTTLRSLSAPARTSTQLSPTPAAAKMLANRSDGGASSHVPALNIDANAGGNGKVMQECPSPPLPSGLQSVRSMQSVVEDGAGEVGDGEEAGSDDAATSSQPVPTNLAAFPIVAGHVMKAANAYQYLLEQLGCGAHPTSSRRARVSSAPDGVLSDAEFEEQDTLFENPWKQVTQLKLGKDEEGVKSCQVCRGRSKRGSGESGAEGGKTPILAVVEMVLESVEEMCRDYDIKWVEINCKALITLSSSMVLEYGAGGATGSVNFSLWRNKDDIFALIENQAEVHRIMSTPGQFFRGPGGAERAATKIQATWKMFVLRRVHVDVIRHIRAAEVFVYYWQMKMKRRSLDMYGMKRRQALMQKGSTIQIVFPGLWPLKYQGQKRVVIHLPAVSCDDPELRRKIMSNDALQWQCRQFGRLADLRDPDVTVIYVSLPIVNDEMDQIQQAIGETLSLKDLIASHRLHIIIPETSGFYHPDGLVPPLPPFSPYTVPDPVPPSLTSMLLTSDKALQKIRSITKDLPSVIVPGVVGDLEAELSGVLNIPLLNHNPINSKIAFVYSMQHEIAKEMNILTPPRRSFSPTDRLAPYSVYEALGTLVKQHTNIRRWVLKINYEVDDEGVAYVDIPEELCHDLLQNPNPDPDDLASLFRSTMHPVRPDLIASVDLYLLKFVTCGGVIEATPPVHTRTAAALTSSLSIPSLSSATLAERMESGPVKDWIYHASVLYARVDPDGRFCILGSADEISVPPYRYWGAIIPQQTVHPLDINEAAKAVADHCYVSRGIYGYMSIEFVSWNDQSVSIKPYITEAFNQHQMTLLLSAGRPDPEAGQLLFDRNQGRRMKLRYINSVPYVDMEPVLIASQNKVVAADEEDRVVIYTDTLRCAQLDLMTVQSFVGLCLDAGIVFDEKDVARKLGVFLIGLRSHSVLRRAPTDRDRHTWKETHPHQKHLFLDDAIHHGHSPMHMKLKHFERASSSSSSLIRHLSHEKAKVGRRAWSDDEIMMEEDSGSALWESMFLEVEQSQSTNLQSSTSTASMHFSHQSDLDKGGGSRDGGSKDAMVQEKTSTTKGDDLVRILRHLMPLPPRSTPKPYPQQHGGPVNHITFGLLNTAIPSLILQKMFPDFGEERQHANEFTQYFRKLKRIPVGLPMEEYLRLAERDMEDEEEGIHRPREGGTDGIEDMEKRHRDGNEMRGYKLESSRNGYESSRPSSTTSNPNYVRRFGPGGIVLVPADGVPHVQISSPSIGSLASSSHRVSLDGIHFEEGFETLRATGKTLRNSVDDDGNGGDSSESEDGRRRLKVPGLAVVKEEGGGGHGHGRSRRASILNSPEVLHTIAELLMSGGDDGDDSDKDE
ncbi:hypothetical protein HK102_000972 [Quaeritorhiza haematococci]|nr:hypothetical protein HK102_000972 [Quaeritorhiza haematococci]